MISLLSTPIAAVQWTILQLGVPEYLEQTIASIVAFLPRLIGAVIILLIGWVVGRIVGRLVRELTDRVELDRAVLSTPLGRILGGTEQAVSKAFGTISKWFVYAIAILAAADVLAISLLSEWVSTAVTYIPAFIAGLLIIVLGFVVADFIGDAITNTRAATETPYTSWFATGTRMFLYFMAIVIGLDTMGVDVAILYLFARALAWGLAAAIALGVGIALGWGGRDYVAENIDKWARRSSEATPSPEGSSGTGSSSSGTGSSSSGTDTGSSGTDSSS